MNRNVANRECVNMVLVDYSSKKPFLNIDYANVTTTEMSATRVYAKGGYGAPNRVTFDGERAGTMALETQITPMKLFALLSGTEIKKLADVLKREEKILVGTDLTVEKVPIAGSVYVYKYDDDCGETLEITVVDKVITPEGGIEDEKYIIYYLTHKEDKVETITFNSAKFPKNYIIYGETLYKTEDSGEMLPMLLKAYKASPQTSFSLGLSNTGDPSSLNITFDLLSDENGDILDMTLIEEDD